MGKEPTLQPENHESKQGITIPEELLREFKACKRPTLPGMTGVRYKTLDEFIEKGGKYINSIPFRLRSLEESYNNPNASIQDLWLTLHDYEDLFKGLQFAKKDGMPIDELLNQVQKLGYNALLRAAEILLNKLRENYDPNNNEDEFREITFWFKDYFKNILVTGQKIPPELEQSYYDFLRSSGHDEGEIAKRSNYVREEAKKILEL